MYEAFYPYGEDVPSMGTRNRRKKWKPDLVGLNVQEEKVQINKHHQEEKLKVTHNHVTICGFH